MGASTSKKKRFHLWQIIAAGVGLALGVFFLFFEAHRLENVLLIDDGGAPHVVYTERVSSEDSDDYYRVTTVRASDGERLKRSEIGDTEGEFKAYWRVYERKAWLVERGQPDLFDLLTHTYADVSYPLVHTGLPTWPVTSGALRATLASSKANVYIHADGDVSEAKGQERRSKLYPCWRQPSKIPLQNASVRGCWGKERAFIQTSRGADKRDWMLRLTAPGGDYGASTWELSAKELTGNDEAWFGDALVSGDAVWVVLVEPSYLLVPLFKTRSFRFVEVSASDGAIVVNKVL